MNDTLLIGTISAPKFDHEVNGDRIYAATLTTSRTSGAQDMIPLLIPEYMVAACPARVRVAGEFRSHNCPPDANGHKQLQLYLYVQNMWAAYGEPDSNIIKLCGYICKTPITRTTPLGKTITDLLVAVPRTNIYDRSDYIPVIAWGNNTPLLNIGDCVAITGRIQSRTHAKGIAYEVSASDLTLQTPSGTI